MDIVDYVYSHKLTVLIFSTYVVMNDEYIIYQNVFSK